jgi:hypothetical protein
LLKEVSFTLDSELGLPCVFARNMNQADSWANFKIGRVKALAMGTIECIGHAKDTRKKMKVILFRFWKVHIPSVGWGGNAFTVIAGE